MFSKKMATMILGLSAALLTGCEAEQTEKDMIAEAQFCMDEARDAASANACVSKISGLTSQQAYTLRCAAGFISAQVTSAENLSKALDAMSDEGAGAASMLSILNFGSKDLAEYTFNACNKSGQKGLSLIGAMAKSATVLGNAVPGLSSCATDPASCNTEQIESAITAIVDDLSKELSDPAAYDAAVQNASDIAETIQTVYSTTCSGTSSANSSICGDINEALTTSGVDINTTNLADLGKALLDQWKAGQTPPTP